MTQTLANHHHHHDAADVDAKDVFGFWIYIMSDCLLFATLFAAYAVLHNNTFGGPSMKDIVSIPYILAETLFLLTSNFTFGLAVLNLYKGRQHKVVGWLIATFFLGLAFVVMEVSEFAHLVHEGHSWQSSGFLSAFFTLVGTHGLHVSSGLLWILVMIIQLIKNKITHPNSRKLVYLGLFWNFLDVVWIFVFTIVYLMGAI